MRNYTLGKQDFTKKLNTAGRNILTCCVVLQNMLKKQYRLKNKAAFNATYRVKNSFHKEGITLFAGITKKNEDTNTLAGFVVSKKTHKRAVKRNRLKRLMREAYRLMLKSDDLGNSQNYMSLIFVGREKALDKNFTEIQNIISSLIRRL